MGVASVTQAASLPSDLDAYRWKSRVLVIVAPERSDRRVAEQHRIVEAAQAGMRERDLVLVEAIGVDAKADALRRRFGVAPGEFRAILVGKDGGAKLADTDPLTAERLFGEIDTMPMRRDEMRRQAGRGVPR